jgi:hypothetical protein
MLLYVHQLEPEQVVLSLLVTAVVQRLVQAVRTTVQVALAAVLAEYQAVRHKEVHTVLLAIAAIVVQTVEQ